MKSHSNDTEKNLATSIDDVLGNLASLRDIIEEASTIPTASFLEVYNIVLESTRARVISMIDLVDENLGEISIISNGPHLIDAKIKRIKA